MFGLWRYSEEWDADSWYPFKSGWFQAQLWYFVVSAMLGLATGLAASTLFLTQPFLAIFIVILSTYAYFKLQKINRRMIQISETT